MTKDDIIKLAHKAGFLIDTHAQQYQPNCILSTYGLIDENLERFAKLVAAAEREWVGLTEEDVKHEWEVWRASLPRYIGFAQGIEAKLKERNNG
jgi:hypothetical protein